ncbi:MAG: thermosome subunit alpha [Candidatus Woesearchaeota archaeon]
MSQKELLPQDTQRQQGRSAQRNNILAGKLVAQTIRSTLGPKGMDKMLVNQLGDVIVTNDGVTILQEIAIEHPTAKMIVEIAKTQEDEVGDGTTSAVIIAGELLNQAEQLLDKNIHPTLITKGYRLASQHALQYLHSIAQPANTKDILLAIAQTAMTGKSAEIVKESLAQLAVEAITSINQQTLDIQHIRIETQVGHQQEDATLIHGLLLDKAKVHTNMPSTVQEARILLLNVALEIRDTETDAKITITNPQQLDAFLQQEEMMIKRMIDAIIKSGATVVCCQRGIDELAQHYLAKAGIMALRRVKKSDMDALSQATGANIVTQVSDIQATDLGTAQSVKQIKVLDEYKTHITGCKHKDIVTLHLAGSTSHVVEEVKRAMLDALGDLRVTLLHKKAVGGAGAVEIKTAHAVRQYAQTLSGREQLAVYAFAEAMESIPITLAENAGLDPIDVLTSLKSSQEQWPGIDVCSGKTMNAFTQGIIEPLKVKTQAVEAATQVACMILRIDDIIAAGVSEPPSE